MMMWMIIMWTTLAATGAALLYLSNRITRFAFTDKLSRGNLKLKGALGVIIAFGLFALIGLALNYMNAIVCAVYFALIWGVCDFLFKLTEKFCKITFKRYYSGAVAVVLSVAALGCGWYLNHNVWKTEYTFKTNKITQPLKIAMFADAHLGTTFNAEGFAAHLKEIEKQNPDVLFIVGDYVDDSSTRDEMLAANKALGEFKTKYGVYFVFGNHDKGYYGSEYRGFSWFELIDDLQKNGVKVLIDETALINDEFYIIGRRDYSAVRETHGYRKPMKAFAEEIDNQKYSIVLDHQPTDYKNQAEAQVDLVLSGHTHGGQLFPFNKVGKWIGANDAIYGHEKHNKTDFIVTSGISDWAIKFKTGTKSEYVIINVMPAK